MKKIFSFLAVAMLALTANATDYYLVGTAPGWDASNETYKFVDVDGVLTVTVADLYGDVKVTQNGGWHPQYGANAAGDKLQLNTPYVLQQCDDSQGEADAPNLALDLEENYVYKNAKLTLNVEGTQLTLTLVEGTLYNNATAPVVYSLIGACTDNWSLASSIDFTDVDGVLTANIPDLNGTFKIIKTQGAKNWDFAYGVASDRLDVNTPLEIVKWSGEGGNIALANPFGGYKNAVMTIVPDASDEEKANLTLVSGEFYAVQNDWHIPGEKLGWHNTEAQRFSPVEGQENTFVRLEAEFSGEFKVVYGDWGVEFGANVKGEAAQANVPYVMTYPCADNLRVADDATLIDVTITITVDYEKAEVTLLLGTEAAGVEDVKTAATAVKRIQDGQIVIVRDGVRFNVLGTKL